MTRKELKNKIKEEQKETASAIKILKAARKPRVFESNPDFYKAFGDLETHRFNYRNIHIAYCTFFNNTPYEKIERKCNTDKYDRLINSLKTQWEEEISNEVICVAS